jgi:hypothetical protein
MLSAMGAIFTIVTKYIEINDIQLFDPPSSSRTARILTWQANT